MLSRTPSKITQFNNHKCSYSVFIALLKYHDNEIYQISWCYNVHWTIFGKVLIRLKVNELNWKLLENFAWKFCDIFKRNATLFINEIGSNCNHVINSSFVLQDIEIFKCSPESGWGMKFFSLGSILGCFKWQWLQLLWKDFCSECFMILSPSCLILLNIGRY